MPLSVHRVCRRIHARLDGEGVRRVGGRWNSPGRPIVYMAQSIALAVLENLVHMTRQDYPLGYVVITAIVPDHVLVLDELPCKTRRAPSPPQTHDRWATPGLMPDSPPYCACAPPW